MTSRLRRGSALSIALGVVLALACVVSGAASAGAAALPTIAPLRFSFENLMPGQPETQTQSLDVPVASSITRVQLREGGPAGAVAWDALLCPTSGSCITLVDAAAGVPLTPGRYALTVTATALTLAPGEVGTLEGRLLIVESGGQLAATGTDLVWPLLAAASAMLGVGMFLVVLARRRERKNPNAGSLTADAAGGSTC